MKGKFNDLIEEYGPFEDSLPKIQRQVGRPAENQGDYNIDILLRKL